MSNNKIKFNTKTIARIAAIQSMYQYQINDQPKNIDEIVDDMLLLYKDDSLKDDLDLDHDKSIKIKPSTSYLKELVKFTSQNLEQLNKIIAEHLSEPWTTQKLPKVLTALLQVAICELKFFPEVPKKVIINEYTDIASSMITDQEIAFVNSVLDKISTEVSEPLNSP